MWGLQFLVSLRDILVKGQLIISRQIGKGNQNFTPGGHIKLIPARLIGPIQKLFDGFGARELNIVGTRPGVVADGRYKGHRGSVCTGHPVAHGIGEAVLTIITGFGRIGQRVVNIDRHGSKAWWAGGFYKEQTDKAGVICKHVDAHWRVFEHGNAIVQGRGRLIYRGPNCPA